MSSRRRPGPTTRDRNTRPARRKVEHADGHTHPLARALRPLPRGPDDRPRRDDRERRAATIREDLGFSETSLAWVVNSYLLTFGGFLLLGGRLGDLYGHRRLF